MMIRFDPRDLWIGVYWDWKEPYAGMSDSNSGVVADLHIYICIIPCFPLHITWRTAC